MLELLFSKKANPYACCLRVLMLSNLLFFTASWVTPVFSQKADWHEAWFHFPMHEVESGFSPEGVAYIPFLEDVDIEENTEGIIFKIGNDSLPKRLLGVGGKARIKSFSDGLAKTILSIDYVPPYENNDEPTPEQVFDYDLVGLPVRVKHLPQGELFKLSQWSIELTDVDGGYFYDPMDALRMDFTEDNLEEDILDLMVEDLKYTGEAMLEQMDEIMIAEGPYAGKGVLQLLTESTKEDLLSFFAYLNYRPTKYAGRTWKISEIFATWAHEGAPGDGEAQLKALMADLGLDQVLEEKKDRAKEQFALDLEAGTLGGLKPTATQEEVKAKIPTFTGDSEDGGDFNCGGGVFFNNHKFFFYTYRDYIEVRDPMNIIVKHKLFGLNQAEVRKVLGEPYEITHSPVMDNTQYYAERVNDNEVYYLYKKKYGTLCLRFDENGTKMAAIQLHAVEPHLIKYCN